MTNQEAVNDMQDVNTLVNLQISLARIEETLKPLAALVPTVAELKDVSKEALAFSQMANQKLDALEPLVDSVRLTAEDARRKAEEALQRLDELDENNEWIRRSFYGPLISSIASIFIAAFLAYLGLTGK